MENKKKGYFINEYLSNVLQEVSPSTFYENLFDLANLQESGVYNDGRYNAIMTNTTKKYNKVVTRDLYVLEEAFNSETDQYILRPISYAGKRPIKEMARELYSLTIDLDGVIVDDNGFPSGIDNFIEFCQKGIFPLPTYLVSSGSGLHLYYIFKKPIKLYLGTKSYNQLCKLRNALITKIWDNPITDIVKSDIQYESVWQGFRVVGSLTKFGTRTTAYELGKRVDIDYLNTFVANDNKMIDFTPTKKYTLTEAKEKFPEWYEKTVVNGEKGRRTYILHRRVYEYFRDRVKIEGRSGHRYNCLLCLVAFGVKCNVDYEEIEKDLYELREILDARTVDESNHLTEKDVKDALNAYKDKEKLILMKRKTITMLSNIELKESKRNYRKQKKHLEIARMIQEKENPNWRNKDGRPTKEKEIIYWQIMNPTGNKSQCAKDLSISRSTVHKWWDNGLKGNKFELDNRAVKVQPMKVGTDSELSNVKIPSQLKSVKIKMNAEKREALKEEYRNKK